MLPFDKFFLMISVQYACILQIVLSVFTIYNKKQLIFQQPTSSNTVFLS